MLAFDPIRVMSHDFLTVLQYFAIPPELYKNSEAVDRLERKREKGGRGRRRATKE